MLFTKKYFFALPALSLLAACGGGSTGISSDPITGPELEQIFSDFASASDTGDEDILNAFDTSIDDLTVRDVTAAGSASYAGAVILGDLDLSSAFADQEIDVSVDDIEEDLPTFLMVGRSELTVTFGNNPEVSGGANGFIGLNVASLETVELPDSDDFGTLFDALPTVDVDGSLTYSNGFVEDFDADLPNEDDNGLGFDVSGQLELTNALTGAGGQTVEIDGQGLAVFAGELGVGALDLSSGGQTLGGILVGVADE